MHVVNLTRFPFATLVTSRRPPQPEMVVIVRGRFDPVHAAALRPRYGMEGAPFDPLAQGVISGDTFAEEDDAALGAVLHPSDLAPFKLNAEVLVVGPAHAPNARAVPECVVGVKVGAWSKGLKVLGQRFSGGKPQPFTTMPLDWRHSYGGPGHDVNPVGKGVAGPELPNVYPADGSERAESLGAINPRWASRWSKVGQNYGPAWKKTRAPWPSDDFDWSHHHSALPDQQLRGYLQGDEELSLTNLHPDHPQLQTRLPGLKVRAFVRRATREIVEVPMTLDTLTVRSDEGAVDLTWRGLVSVKEDDLVDVLSLLLVTEAPGAAQTADHYRALLEKHEADPNGALAATPPELIEARDRGMATMEKMRVAQDDLRTGKKTPEEAIPDVFASALPPGDPRAQEVREAARKSLADAAAHAPKDDRSLAKLKEAMPAARGPSPAPFRLPDPKGPPKIPPQRDLGTSIDKALDEARRARVELERDPRGEAPAKADELISRLEELKKDPRFELIFKPRVEPGPGRDLSDQDLEGEDLRGADLRGANLEGSVLTRADLRGANLTGARLSHAVLFQARLDEADLSGCSLTLTNFSEAVGQRLRLREAIVDRTFFERASLPGLDASGLRGKNALFIETTLSQASFDGAQLEQAFFDRATLDGASFRRARLVRCLVTSSSLRGAQLEGAEIGGSSFMRSNATGACFDGATGGGAVFLEAILDEATFLLARLPTLFGSHASAKGAQFYGADLRGARFVRATLDRSSFERANLKDADLRKAQASGASFRGASLFGANLLGAAGRDADFGGANLKRAQIDGVS